MISKLSQAISCLGIGTMLMGSWAIAETKTIYFDNAIVYYDFDKKMGKIKTATGTLLSPHYESQTQSGPTITWGNMIIRGTPIYTGAIFEARGKTFRLEEDDISSLFEMSRSSNLDNLPNFVDQGISLDGKTWTFRKLSERYEEQKTFSAKIEPCSSIGACSFFLENLENDSNRLLLLDSWIETLFPENKANYRDLHQLTSAFQRKDLPLQILLEKLDFVEDEESIGAISQSIRGSEWVLKPKTTSKLCETIGKHEALSAEARLNLILSISEEEAKSHCLQKLPLTGMDPETLISVSKEISSDYDRSKIFAAIAKQLSLNKNQRKSILQGCTSDSQKLEIVKTFASKMKNSARYLLNQTPLFPQSPSSKMELIELANRRSNLDFGKIVRLFDLFPDSPSRKMELIQLAHQNSPLTFDQTMNLMPHFGDSDSRKVELAKLVDSHVISSFEQIYRTISQIQSDYQKLELIKYFRSKMRSFKLEQSKAILALFGRGSPKSEAMEYLPPFIDPS